MCAVVGVAHAQTTFSSISATYSMNPSSGTKNWQVFQNSPSGTIDFIGNAPAFKIGASTGFFDGTSTITYNVVSSAPIGSIDLLMQGDVQNFGRVTYTQVVTGGSGSLGSTSGNILGGSYSGGVNGAFTKLVHLDFSQAVTSFSVTHSMFIDINGQTLPSTSVAMVNLVEQNFTSVPEPATFAALGLGAAALIRRRRKK